jgi:hypothetical protein
MANVIGIEQPVMVKTWENVEISIKNLTDWLLSETIEIPPWQREFTWPPQSQQNLAACIMKKDPMPQILLRQLPNLHYSLEDGRQRLTSLRNFRDDKVAVNGKKFSEFSQAEQNQFLTYKMPVQIYRGFSVEEAVQLFINRQQGVALTLGEKYYAVDSFSPLVRTTRNLLMKAGQGLHNEAVAVWGRLCDETGPDGMVIIKDNKRKWLERACAIVAGLAWGSKWITKKPFDVFKIVDGHNMMTRPIYNEDVGETEEEALQDIRLKLMQIIDIYKAVQAKKVVSHALIKKQFDPGFATGYIIYGLNLSPERRPLNFKDKWVDFLVSERVNTADARAAHPPTTYVPILSRDVIVGPARSWSDTRWENGHNYLFPPPGNAVLAAAAEDEDEDEDVDTVDYSDTEPE